jgi:hypothetical protein
MPKGVANTQGAIADDNEATPVVVKLGRRRGVDRDRSPSARPSRKPAPSPLALVETLDRAIQARFQDDTAGMFGIFRVSLLDGHERAARPFPEARKAGRNYVVAFLHLDHPRGMYQNGERPPKRVMPKRAMPKPAITMLASHPPRTADQHAKRLLPPFEPTLPRALEKTATAAPAEAEGRQEPRLAVGRMAHCYAPRSCL